MNTKNQDSKQQNQHGHQNEPPKKGQNPNDPQNQQAEHPQKMGVDDLKERNQRQGAHEAKKKEEHANR